MDEYENETGEKATYRKDSSDYHTLRYVRWLEERIAERDKEIERLKAELKIAYAVNKWEEDGGV